MKIGVGFPAGALPPDYERDINFQRQSIHVYKLGEYNYEQTFKAIVESPSTPSIRKFQNVGYDYSPEKDYALVDTSLVRFNKSSPPDFTPKQLTILDERYHREDDFPELSENTKSKTHLFRGMSGEEWESIVNKGFIESKGTYNFSTQTGLTFFDPRPVSAASYAAGFAPWQYIPTFLKPGVVIKIKRPDDSQIAVDPMTSEVGVKGKIPISEIEKVYEIRVAAQHPGDVEYVYKANTNTLHDISHSAAVNFELYREVPRNEWSTFIPSIKDKRGKVVYRQGTVTLREVETPSKPKRVRTPSLKSPHFKDTGMNLGAGVYQDGKRRHIRL